MTSGRGDRMQGDISKLKDRVDAMDRRDTEINEQVARLRSVLDQATDLLKRNSADVGAKAAKAETDIAALTGQIEEAKHLLEDIQRKLGDHSNRLAGLEQTQGKIIDRVAPNIPEDKESLWREAQTRMNGGQRDDARRFFKAFVQRFPQDPRVPQAQILIGQSLAAEGKHTNALAELQIVIDKYPRAGEVPEAMWLMAQSFTELKQCSFAKVLLQDLAKRYPRSPRVNDSRVKLRELQRVSRDKRVCLE